MKKTPILFLLLALLGLQFSSCEDSIDLDLGTPVEQIVIDAVINQTTDTQFVYITRSMGYLDNGNYKGYEMDSVGILDTANNTFHLFTSRGNGVYYFVPPAANTFSYGNTYQLIARDGADTYFSQSTLHSPTQIDSLTYKYQESGAFGGGKGYYMTLWAKDKPGAGDYYWFKLYRNDSLQANPGDIRIAADNSTTRNSNGDGDLFIIPIRENLTQRPFQKGDQARVEILTIQAELFYYLTLINTQLNNQGLFAVPPSNVPGNIVCLNNPDKKVLGFFSMVGKVSSQTLNFR